MLMTLIRSRLQGRDDEIKMICDFIDFTSKRDARTRDFCSYVHSTNRTYAYLRTDRKIKFRMVFV